MESGSIDGANIVFREGVCQEVAGKFVASWKSLSPHCRENERSAPHKKMQNFCSESQKARWFAIFLRSEAAVSKNYINLAADYGYVCP